ncbi:MAG TPA: hypothetical protein VKM55_14795 [Candidatus Lokiarchaeia archaeon]|nr:hypothetical protein [Candidatus Lokiarchaeia archaeon]
MTIFKHGRSFFMIYSIYLIDADNAVLLLEKIFQPLKKPATQQDLIDANLAEFFSSINTFIDEVQAAMRKGRDVSNMNRILLAENSTITMHYDPEARVLVSTISDPDDDTDVIIAAAKRIGERFWKKHQVNIEEFRIHADKSMFKAFIPDIEMVFHDGKIAEIFPRLQVPLKTLQRINAMGVISNDEYQVGVLLDGAMMSPLAISKQLGKTKAEIMDILKKFESLDIIKAMKIPKF